MPSFWFQVHVWMCARVYVVKKWDCLVVTSLLWGRPLSFTSSFCARSPEMQLLRQQGLSQWGCIYKRRFHYEVFVKKMLHCPRVSQSHPLSISFFFFCRRTCLWPRTRTRMKRYFAGATRGFWLTADFYRTCPWGAAWMGCTLYL